ncbi:unnamed protein product, partial [Rotaria sp. Silwood2]
MFMVYKIQVKFEEFCVHELMDEIIRPGSLKNISAISFGLCVQRDNKVENTKPNIQSNKGLTSGEV